MFYMPQLYIDTMWEQYSTVFSGFSIWVNTLSLVTIPVLFLYIILRTRSDFLRMFLGMTPRDLEGYRLNFGPQHPAAHGVMRLIIDLRGEEIQHVDAQIGLLHRGTEKLAENKTAMQILPYWDRLDYVSTMALEYAFSRVVEQTGGVEVSENFRFIRVLFVELTRILNHLLAITTHAMDVGALTPFLWGFEEREKIMEFYERVCGARLHANYIRPYGISTSINVDFLVDMCFFIESCLARIDQIEMALRENRIWKERLSHVGVLTQESAKACGCTGVLLRSTGISVDLRRNTALNDHDYSFYDFDIPVGTEGDCYDRFILRIEEMRQSLNIIDQSVGELLLADDLELEHREWLKSHMAVLIEHFKGTSEGLNISDDSIYFGIEAPKGEMGACLMGSGRAFPWRMKIRSPGYFHLSAINSLCGNGLLADFVTVIGTLDLVLGEIDR